MPDDLQERADVLFERRRAETGARDPRDHYRNRLRELKGTSPAAYEEAVAYYRDTLLPSIVSAEADPVAAWIDYGRRIANLAAEGRTVTVDATGRSHEYAFPAPTEHLVLHLPRSGRERAEAVGIPPEPSPAQQAAYDLLVARRQRLRSAGEDGDEP